MCIHEINTKSLTMSKQAMVYVSPFASIFLSQKFLPIMYLSLVMTYLTMKLIDCFFLVINGSVTS